MADKFEGSSNMSSQQGVSDWNRVASHGGERSVVAEFIDAARSTAESLLEDQKKQVAERVKGVAEALEGAARSLHGSQNRMVARYVQQAGDQVKKPEDGREPQRIVAHQPIEPGRLQQPERPGVADPLPEGCERAARAVVRDGAEAVRPG